MKVKTTAFYLVLLVAVAAAIAAFVMHYRSIYPVLPYRDSFAKQEASEWIPLGGSWSVNHDEMINRSDEPGSTLISGSPLWADYQIDTDLELRAHGGDVGVAMRVSDPEIGINAYRGYYIGLRSNDSALVIGRADNNWLESRPISVSEGVRIGVWCHLRVVVVGCKIAAEATDSMTGQKTYAAFRDESQECIATGRIGLRSTDTSGGWRNVQVRAATDRDLETVLQHVSIVGTPQYPIREDDYSQMRLKYFPDFPQFADEGPIDARAVARSPLVSVASLATNRDSLSPVRIAGVITFTKPTFLQDPTGGVMIQLRSPQILNIGDEVEIAGRLVMQGDSPLFQADSVQTLRERTAVSPISITPTEAATGTHVGELVEVTGVVDKRTKLEDGTFSSSWKIPLSSSQ